MSNSVVVFEAAASGGVKCTQYDGVSDVKAAQAQAASRSGPATVEGDSVKVQVDGATYSIGWPLSLFAGSK